MTANTVTEIDTAINSSSETLYSPVSKGFCHFTVLISWVKQDKRLSNTGVTEETLFTEQV